MMQDSSSSSPRTTLIISQHYFIKIRKVFRRHVSRMVSLSRGLDNDCSATPRAGVAVACHRLHCIGRLLTRPVRMASIASSMTVQWMLKLKWRVMWTWISAIFDNTYASLVREYIQRSLLQWCEHHHVVRGLRDQHHFRRGVQGSYDCKHTEQLLNVLEHTLAGV